MEPNKTEFFLSCKCHDAFLSEFMDGGLKEVNFALKATHKHNAQMEATELWEKIQNGVVYPETLEGNAILASAVETVAQPITLKKLKRESFADWGHYNPSLKQGDETWELI